MPIKIYNSLTRKKDDLEPLKKDSIKMYVCGPTVYDEPHIGHARSAYIFEVIRRYLEYKKLKVTFVKNVTDVDDKIIEKAKKVFAGEDLNEAVKKVSAKYLEAYHRDMKELGIKRPDKEPKATEYIGKMIGFIEKLIERDAAYVSDGDVYFNIKKAEKYGKLSGQSLDKMEVGARVSSGENKRDALDFALWKKAKEGEPLWDSPWGKGRPGWHIECSVMSSDILGDEFDIHGGGIDLIFPHHENEIAQSEAAGKKFAKVWMHHGLLTINNQKMAKSLGNFITIKDFVNKYHDLDFLKFFFLTTHYAHPADFSGEKIKETRESLERIMIFLNKSKKEVCSTGHSHKKIKEIEGLRHKFEEAMDDDFNTPRAVACIFELVNIANKKMEDSGFVCVAAATIKELLLFFGISPEKGEPGGSADLEINTKIVERNVARQNKDYALSDKIRVELESKGIILEDTKDGTTWRRKI